MITKDEAVKAYDQLIQLRRQNQLEKSKENPGQIEIHHIIPLSCNGLDVPENKIALLAKEHFMAHVYLWVIHHKDEFHYQTTCALKMMVNGTLDGNRKELRDFILMSEEYQKAKEEFSSFVSETIGDKISGENNGAFGKHWYYDPVSLNCAMLFEEDVPDGWQKGRLVSNSFRENVSQAIKDTVWIHTIDYSLQSRIKLSEANNLVSTGLWVFGHLPYSNDIKQQMRQKCLETRIKNGTRSKMPIEYKECLNCGNEKASDSKMFCCDTCKEEFHQKRLEEKFQQQQKTLVSQINEVGMFPAQTSKLYEGVVDRKIARRYFDAIESQHCCANCGKTDVKLTLHSKDGNCKNLAIGNYEFLCRECYLASGTAGFSGRHQKKKKK